MFSQKHWQRQTMVQLFPTDRKTSFLCFWCFTDNSRIILVPCIILALCFPIQSLSFGENYFLLRHTADWDIIGLTWFHLMLDSIISEYDLIVNPTNHSRKFVRKDQLMWYFLCKTTGKRSQVTKFSWTTWKRSQVIHFSCLESTTCQNFLNWSKNCLKPSLVWLGK